MNDLTLAFYCAMTLGDFSAIPDVADMPQWIQAKPSPEMRISAAKPDMTGAYLEWPTASGEWWIFADDWSVLVHEMTHHIQRLNGLPYDERLAGEVERQAYMCLEEY